MVEPPLGKARVAEEIVIDRAGDAVVVDAAVLEEAAVLNCGDGLDQPGRDLGVGDEAALGAGLVFRERADELGLELVSGERGAILGDDGLDFCAVQAAGGGDGGAVGRVEALWAGLNGDAVSAVELVSSEKGAGTVAGAAEIGSDLGNGEGLAGAELARGGVDLGDGGEERAGGEAVVNDGFVVVIKVDEKTYADENDSEDEHGEEADQVAREQATVARAGGRARRW